MRMSPGANRKRLVRRLITHGPRHRAELSRELGTSRATITTLTQQLLEDGVLAPDESGPVGEAARPVTPRRESLGISARRGIIAQLAFHATTTVAALTTLDGRILRWSLEPRPRLAHAEDWLVAAEKQLALLLHEAGRSTEDIAHLHLALNTQVDHRTREILDTRAAGPWRNVSPARHVERWTSAPWSVQNTARQAALAEYLALPSPRPLNLVHVSLSWGIGMGQIFDGRIVTGERGATGELGHVSIDPHGIPCDCGNRGCLGVHAGLGVMLERAGKALGHEVTTVEEVATAAAEGHEGCIRILNDTGHSVGTALGAVCNLLGPDVIVIGGEAGNASELLVTAARQRVNDIALPLTTRHLRILPAGADRDPLSIITSGHSVLTADQSIVDSLAARALGTSEAPAEQH